MSEKSPGKRRSLLSRGILLIIILVFVLAGLYGGWQFYEQRHNLEVAQKEADPAPPVPVFMPLDTFTVNLLDDENSLERVLYIGITLRLPDEESRRHMNEYLPEVRSRLLMLFSRQHAAALAGEGGKQQLIKDIKTVLAPPLVPGRPNQIVTDVLFTAFILR
ncbi:flagellar basal body-associated protein FliL [Enterobacillus tribolii]|uniref:Flagellar protein FliL n=1 Tax=Enterobacillus tribolii TaxID=1487935 RepID=A0A370R2X5_9GAMM|nr:flagellar basal body-associated protein FliL [Enterobacillus tribolii]MBW7984786.1 flagellar basal body-associated protein FliL [Enterobacillus tribolii]RDK96787.1 flagellar FliL protein [Enterobacillus tribolii]